jgi:hypothetical protein
MKNIKYTLNCFVCKKDFRSNQPHQKFCGNDCRKKNYYDQSGRIVLKTKHLSTGSVWKISEMAVNADLLKRGYTVFYALSTDSFCDIVAVKDNKILFVEARTGYKNSYTNKYTFPTGLRGMANVYGVYERNSEKVHYFDNNKEIIDDISKYNV